MWVQLKAWEEYTSKLEEKYVALMIEHESFQRELAAVRGIGSDPVIHGTLRAQTHTHTHARTHPPALLLHASHIAPSSVALNMCLIMLRKHFGCGPCGTQQSLLRTVALHA